MITMSRTVIATPPGETIREQLESRKMTQKDFALRMEMSEKHISHLINGEVRLTPNTAMRLEAVLGIPAYFWNNLEAIYQTKRLKAEEENAMDADIELIKKMPFSEMVKFGWIEPSNNVVDRVRKMRQYFEVARLEVLENLIMPGIAYRRTSTKEKSDYSLAVWAQRAKLLAREREVLPINLQKLQSIVPEVRAMTTQAPEKFTPKLQKMFSECGIALIYLPHMKGSFLHGASFVDGKKIVMALTVRGHDADKFWFSVFHEVGHILEGHINKPFGATEEDEKAADKYARDVLIPPDEYEKFTAMGHYSEKSVKEFSLNVKVDAGIVVGRLQKDGKLKFNQLNGLKKHYELS